MSEQPFGGRTLRWLLGISVISFVGGLMLSVFGPELVDVPSTGTDSFSRSAIGHRAFVNLLDELDIPVVSSRHASAEKARKSGLLVVAEPHDCAPGTPRAQIVADMVLSSSRVLLVLPKWWARESRVQAGEVENLELRSAKEANDVLEAAGSGARVTRISPMAAGPWETGSIGSAPTFKLHTVQLISGHDVRPLISCAGGVLLGELSDHHGKLLVLSDPDVLSNGGLGLGENAVVAVGAVETVRPSGGAVVVDETIHGFEMEPSIWRQLFSFPLVVITLHGVLMLLVMLWAGMKRFGAPERPDPALEPGHRFLIKNTADLLRYRGQVAPVLHDYLNNAYGAVRSDLHAPRELEAAELDAWLDRVGETRGVRDKVEDLRNDVRGASLGPARPAAVLAAAINIHRWRQEILHGPSGRTRDS